MNKRLAICIGAQKAGTTWLADYCRAHPQIHLPLVKEVHFFDARFAPKWCARYEEEMLADLKQEVAGLTIETCGNDHIQRKLHALLLRLRMIESPSDYVRFLHWGARDEKVLFEATPDYSMIGEVGFQAMRNIYPDTRIVFLLRNPADRFVSSMRFNKTHRPGFDLDGEWRTLMHREDFQLLGDYGRTIRAASTSFGPDQFHIEFYERLFEQGAVDRICDFLGVDRDAANFSVRSNASKSVEIPAEIRPEAVKAYRAVYKDIHNHFAGDLPASWLADMAQAGG